MFCRQCGNKCEDGELFCGNCGTPLTQTEDASAAAQQAADSAQAQTEEFVQQQGARAEEIPQYAAPQYTEPQNSAPQYNAPQYGAPQYGVPQYGAPQQQYGAQPQMNGFYAAPQQPVKAKKKTGKKVLISIVSVLAVLALLVGLAFVVFPKQSKSIFAKIFYSDEKNFKMIESDEIDEKAADIADAFSKLQTYASGDKQAITNLSVKAGIESYIFDLITQQMDQSIDLDWLSEIGIDFSTNTEDDINAGLVKISLSGGEALTVDYRVDAENGKLYLAIPDLSDKYIELDASTLTGMFSGMFNSNSFDFGFDDDADDEEDDYFGDFSSGLDFGSYGEQAKLASQAVVKLLSSIPSEKVETLASRYGKIIVDEIKKVEKESETLEIGDVSEELTAYVATISEKDSINIRRAVLKAMKDDKDIKEIVEDIKDTLTEFVDMMNGYESYVDPYDQLIEGIESSLENLKDEEEYATDDTAIVYTVWVDAEGEVKGHSIDVPDYSGDLVNAMYYKKVESDGSCAFEGKVSTSVMSSLPLPDSISDFQLPENVRILGYGEEDGDNFTGDVYVYGETYGDEYELLKIKFEDFNFEEIKDGKLNGKATVSAGDGLVDYAEENMSYSVSNAMQTVTQITLDCDFSCDGEEQAFNIGVQLLGQSMLTLEGSADNGDNDVRAEIPSSSEVVSVDDEEGLLDWAKGFKVDSFVDKLESAGVPSELCEMLEEALSGVTSNDDE